jgi:HlyD family secretion protein
MTAPPSDADASQQPAEPLDRLRIDRSALAARRRRRLVPWLVIALVVLGIGLAVFATMGEELFAPTVRTARVTRVAATEGIVRTTANGYVVARRRAAISSRLSGRLEKLTVDVDSNVQEGELLGQLGHADLDAAVLEARAVLAVRKWESETARRDADASVATAAAAKARIAEPEASLREMQSRLVDAERTLERETRLKPGLATSQEALDRATMERDVARQKLEQARARVESLTADAESARLAAEAATARRDATTAQIPVAEAALGRAQATRADADIVAPFAGRVIRKEAELGEMVAPVNAAGSTTRGAIVTLADFSTLEMEVDVIERDIGRIEVDAPCRIVLDARRDHPYAGRVRQIVPTADRTKSTVQVKVAFAKLDEHVFPELGGRVEFLERGATEAQILGSDRLFLPKAALVAEKGRRGAFEVKDRRAVWHDAQQPASPATKDDLVEISGGFSGGEDVVVAPPPRLSEGDLVRVQAPK